MTGWIVVVEPSPFRRAESDVRGPFRWWLAAWWHALRYVNRNPFGEARIVQATSVVKRGDAIVWPRG